ncbi:hypothetical protein [Rosistilla oblonga]|uniref:hypothetical protein n=1 Tax=Rosistilla oblonga TaxID=2527990 RepID=UPI00119F9DA4|nr:hypothetical protein [Rosistilla oblonga]
MAVDIGDHGISLFTVGNSNTNYRDVGAALRRHRGALDSTSMQQSANALRVAKSMFLTNVAERRSLFFKSVYL